MKSVGVVRRLDQLGRVVIPKELRRTHSIDNDDSLEIFVDGDAIILKKYVPACIFCGEAKGIKYIKGKNICERCIDVIRKAE